MKTTASSGLARNVRAAAVLVHYLSLCVKNSTDMTWGNKVISLNSGNVVLLWQTNQSWMESQQSSVEKCDTWKHICLFVHKSYTLLLFFILKALSKTHSTLNSELSRICGLNNKFLNFQAKYLSCRVVEDLRGLPVLLEAATCGLKIGHCPGFRSPDTSKLPGLLSLNLTVFIISSGLTVPWSLLVRSIL